MKVFYLVFTILTVIGCGGIEKNDTFPLGNGPVKKGAGQFSFDVAIDAFPTDKAVNEVTIIRDDDALDSGKNFSVRAWRLNGPDKSTDEDPNYSARNILFEVTNNLTKPACLLSLQYIDENGKNAVTRVFGSYGFSGMATSSCLTSGEKGYAYLQLSFYYDKYAAKKFPNVAIPAGKLFNLSKVEYLDRDFRDLGQMVSLSDPIIDVNNKDIATKITNISSSKLYICLSNKRDPGPNNWFGALVYFDQNQLPVFMSQLYTNASKAPSLQSNESLTVLSEYSALERKVNKLLFITNYFTKECIQTLDFHDD